MAYTQMIRMDRLLPDELDLLLARGFFRMHQGVFTCTFLSNETGLHTVVWTRRALRDAPLPSKARRRLNRIRRELDVEIGPCLLDEEREDLYQRYFEHVGGNRSPSLRGVLFGDNEPDPPEPTGPEDLDDDVLENMIDEFMDRIDDELLEPSRPAPIGHARARLDPDDDHHDDDDDADGAPTLMAEEDVDDEPTDPTEPTRPAPHAHARSPRHAHARLAGDRFDSWEVTVRREGRLIGYSVFDIGRDSIESNVGIYDPDYAHYGVGLGTMMLEIEWGIAHGFSYHYAGYVVPGVSSFEYKRDVGHLEHWCPDQERWRPIDELEPATLIGPRILAALTAAREALGRGRFHMELLVNAPYRIVQLNHGAHQFIGEPWYLRWGPPGSLQRVVTFDPYTRRYALDLCLPSRDLGEVLPSLELRAVPSTTRLLHRLKRVGVVEQPGALLSLFERSLA